MTSQLGRAEREFLTLAVSRDRAHDERLRELAAGHLDWNQILLAALWHKVAFIVYERLRSTRSLDLAVTAGNLHLLMLNHWKQLTKVNELRSRLYESAAAEICQAAELAGVDLAVAKGGVLLFGTAYTRSERKMYDVDFIGKRAQAAEIEDVFRQAGFRYGEYSHDSETIEPPRPGDLRKHLLQGRGLPNFLSKPDSPVIDYLVAQVRFRVGAGGSAGNWIPADAMLGQAETRSGVRAVSWPDLSLQLALHIYREATEVEYQAWNLDWNLIKLCDFDRLVHAAALPGVTGGLVERARELGFTREVAFSAQVTNMIFPSPLLAEIAARCGGTNSTSSAFELAGLGDQDSVREKIWSVGTVSLPQRGAWVEIAGAKTT